MYGFAIISNIIVWTIAMIYIKYPFYKYNNIIWLVVYLSLWNIWKWLWVKTLVPSEPQNSW